MAGSVFVKGVLSLCAWGSWRHFRRPHRQPPLLESPRARGGGTVGPPYVRERFEIVFGVGTVATVLDAKDCRRQAFLTPARCFLAGFVHIQTMPFWGDPEKPLSSPPSSSSSPGTAASSSSSSAAAKDWSSSLASDWLLSMLPEDEAEREAAAQVQKERTV